MTKIDKWLTGKVDAGQGALLLSLTENGDVGVFSERDETCLGVGTTVFETVECAMRREQEAKCKIRHPNGMHQDHDGACV